MLVESIRDEPALVCLHGMLGSAVDWGRVLPRRVAGRQRICPDLLGLLDWGIDDLEGAGRALVAASVPGSWLCGYSLGGRLALHALLADPEHWGGAILVGTHPGLEGEPARAGRRETDQRWAQRFEGEEPWQAVLADWDAQGVLCGSLAPGVAPGWRQRRLNLGDRRRAWAEAMRAWGTGQQENLSAALAALKCPMHLVVGAFDAKFTALAEEMAAANPQDVKVHRLAGCGHRVPWQAPVRMSRLVHRLVRNDG